MESEKLQMLTSRRSVNMTSYSESSKLLNYTEVIVYFYSWSKYIKHHTQFICNDWCAVRNMQIMLKVFILGYIYAHPAYKVW